MERPANTRGHDLPHGRPKTAQAVTVAVLVVGLLIAIFVIQNTESANITFLAWSAKVPIAAALLLAAVLGGVLAFLVAYVRQWQFRRALRRERRTPPPPSVPIGSSDPDAASPARTRDE
jgi:uncharacterized integral membrane protein